MDSAVNAQIRSIKAKKVAGAITSIGSTSSMDDKF